LQSKEILSAGGIVLIFIEGICVHKHELQLFKKGAARIANENKNNTALKILPVGIAYDSLDRFAKTINFNIGEPLNAKELFPYNAEAKNTYHFNHVLKEKIAEKIIVPENKMQITIHQRLFFLPALIGYVLHFPLYYSIKKIVKEKTNATVFYDSVLFGTLLFMYPLYLLLMGLLLFLFHIPVLVILFIILLHPFLAWFTSQHRRAYK
jgi:1-acyl-sn-glycerol-3-phosphate acyltransferase